MKLRIIAFIILSAGLVFSLQLFSCCKECPVGPENTNPYKGWLYAADGATNWLYMIDIETDSLVDSVKVEREDNPSPGALSVSSDGRYLAVGYLSYDLNNDFVRIYDAQNLSIITYIPNNGEHVFIPEENLFIKFADDSVFHYSIPDFSLIYEDSIGSFGLPSYIKEKKLIYLHGTLKPASFDSTHIAAYDFKQKKITQSWFIHDTQDTLVTLHSFDIDPEGNNLYCISDSKNDFVNLICYDLNSEEVVFRSLLPCPYGEVKISPDGTQVYVTDPGYFNQQDIAGIVYIFDAESGNYIDGISLYGYQDNPSTPLYATPIIFTPTGTKAYIGSGRHDKSPGTISVVNTDKSKITKNIWTDNTHYIWNFTIGPK